MNKHYTAAMIVIGNEILSGRTQDKNINYVANKLVECGVSLVEVRIIPDIEKVIVETIHDFQEKVDYIFTSGGIGPTHDDITAECIAKAHDVPLVEDPEARALLLAHYGENDLTDARLKMAKVPEGATLIPNPVSAAPGFIIDKTYCMAGVPRIMQAMMDHIASTLKGGSIIESRTVMSRFPESEVSEGLGEIQDDYDEVEIGSYPYFKDGKLGVNIVLRSSNIDRLENARTDVERMLEAKEKH